MKSGEHDGDSGDNSQRILRVASQHELLQQGLEFFETMTTATSQGWPDIAGDTFLSTLADAVNSDLGKRANSWSLRTQLAELLTSPADTKRLNEFVGRERKATAWSEISEHVQSSLQREFSAFIGTLQSQRTDGYPAVKGSAVMQMIADVVWVYGSRRAKGDAYCQTLALYLDEGCGKK